MNQDTSWEHVVDLGGGEEYFASDYDRVHCRHGSYIGYPGGRDILCHECEMGWDTLYEAPCYYIMWGEEKLTTIYNECEAIAFIERMNELVREGNEKQGLDNPFLHIEADVYHYWGPEGDE